MSDTQTKEALGITIRELSRQNEELRRRYEALLKRPKSERVVTACLGFNLGNVPPNGNLILQAMPQLVFRPERFCISRECAGHFLITDLKVGMNSQFVSSEPIPARLFGVENVHRLREVESEDDFDTAIPIVFDTAFPGMLVTVGVKRIDNSTIPFECVMVGLTLDTGKNELPEGPLTLARRSIRTASSRTRPGRSSRAGRRHSP
jgi:hypothetical protein